MAIKVPVKSRIRDVFGAIKKYLRDERVGDLELFVTMEKSPEDKKKYESMGKVKRMLEHEVQTKLTTHTIRIFWGKDMSVFL